MNPWIQISAAEFWFHATLKTTLKLFYETQVMTLLLLLYNCENVQFKLVIIGISVIYA